MPAEESGFAEGELADVFAEVGLGGLSESADGEAAAIAEIDFVGIELENLLFGEALVDFDSHQHFFYFAAPFALGGEEKAAGHLHVNGAGALGFLADGAGPPERRRERGPQSRPPCSKKRLSSAARTASVRTLGRSSKRTTRRFSRELSKRLVISSGSISAESRGVLFESCEMREIVVPEKSTRRALPSWK